MRYRMKLRATPGRAVPIIVDIDRRTDALAVRAALYRLNTANARPQTLNAYSEWEVWAVDGQGRITGIVGRGHVNVAAP